MPIVSLVCQKHRKEGLMKIKKASVDFNVVKKKAFKYICVLFETENSICRKYGCCLNE